jgi:methionine sulfoxide reductase heme-binding subunit
MNAIAISAQLGLFAVWLLTVNVLLGLLLSVHYNPVRSWPHRRINYFTVHNWTGYIALALSAAHALVLPFSATARWVWADVAWPGSAPQQATGNVLGALALYLLLVVVVTSYIRRRVGRKAWKTVHYASYACALLFYIHGIMLDPKLLDRPINFIDAEKVSIEICVLAVLVATLWRIRHALRRRARGAKLDLHRWEAPVPAEWQEAGAAGTS